MNETPITVRLVDGIGVGLHVANVLVDVRFYMEGRYRYGFSLGRTDSGGFVRTSLADIQAQLEENRSYFLMDYNTPLADCDNAVGVYAPTPDQLAKREASSVKWWPEDDPLAITSNHLVACGEQKFTLRRGEPNEFALVCDHA